MRSEREGRGTPQRQASPAAKQGPPSATPSAAAPNAAEAWLRVVDRVPSPITAPTDAVEGVWVERCEASAKDAEHLNGKRPPPRSRGRRLQPPRPPPPTPRRRG